MNVCDKLVHLSLDDFFQPCLMLAGMAGAYPSEFFQVIHAPSLTHKHQTRLERLAKDKHSSLLRKSVNYGRNNFYDKGPWALCYKTVFFHNLCMFVISQSVCLWLIFSRQVYSFLVKEPTRVKHLSCFTLGQASGLIYKYQARIEKPARNVQTLAYRENQ